MIFSKHQELHGTKKGQQMCDFFVPLNSPQNGLTCLGGAFKYVLFSPLPGEMIQFDEHIFQMGRNHQLDLVWKIKVVDTPKNKGRQDPKK